MKGPLEGMTVMSAIVVMRFCAVSTSLAVPGVVKGSMVRFRFPEASVMPAP